MEPNTLQQKIFCTLKSWMST